jgi:hypothetical protein
MLVLYVLPLATLGVWQLWRRRGGAPGGTGIAQAAAGVES